MLARLRRGLVDKEALLMARDGSRTVVTPLQRVITTECLVEQHLAH